jgi:hypothetical protein
MQPKGSTNQIGESLDAMFMSDLFSKRGTRLTFSHKRGILKKFVCCGGLPHIRTQQAGPSKYQRFTTPRRLISNFIGHVYTWGATALAFCPPLILFITHEIWTAATFSAPTILFISGACFDGRRDD